MPDPKQTVEYSQVNEGNSSIRTFIAGNDGYGRQFSLVHVSEGYEPAGSAARHTRECYRSCYNIGGVRGSKAFDTEAEARSHFEKASFLPQ